MKPTLLIDGDHALYVATAAVEREVWGWGGDEDCHVLFSSLSESEEVFRDTIRRYKRDLGAGKVYIAFTGQENFRYDVDPTYKSGRKSRKPLCYWRLLSSIFDARDLTAKVIPNIEADDLLGIWATNGKIKDPIIVSADKDLKTIPGKLYRQGDVLEITEAEADHFWHLQTLMGDPTDGYPGLPGCGPVTAEKLLVGHAEKGYWNLIVKAYEKKGLTEADALVQARLSRILRATDWNSDKQEVILWTPK